MENNKKRRLGVLLLADVVDYTQQANKLGDDHTRRFNERFEKITFDLAGKYRGSWIKRIGDAVLIFIPRPGDFIQLALELRTLSMERKIDRGDFFADLRQVAHYGNFSFDFLDNTISDLVSAEGIKVFRIEKHALRHDVVVTGDLLRLVKEDLKDLGIRHRTMRKEELKGFDEEVELFALTFPPPGEKKSPGLLDEKMAQLERECREIPVFGRLYPPMSITGIF